jgi:vancomycin resistance protein VanW
MTLKKLIPSSIKLNIKIIQRSIRDTINSPSFAINRGNLKQNDNLTLSQPIYYNPLAQNKIENIKISSQQIEPIVIAPNEVFSFWKLVGNPTTKKGYKTGRNIIGDSLQEDIGGGLCQISGIIYHLALIAGLTIEERFCHTIDLYTEDKRYTPIGTDATVVYGYKDIRFKNETNQSFQFKFETFDDKFVGTLYSDEKINKHQLMFEREEFENHRTINTFRINHLDEKKFINKSKYLLPK